jgi:alkanesulfonate monooxygenase SsuD/methylene tetrahydromethanopterin reductase-like flavin-dependent oxidoreductase (luciferase family)
MSPQFHLFLPQMRTPLPALVERARVAEAAGFRGIALMDHLAPPLALDMPMYEAMATATWLAAHTTTLIVGHLVLCDAFRHPAVLAREAVTIDHASGGRFELGIGWGSVPEEFETFGIGDTAARTRVARFAETLEVVKLLWSGETFDYHGEFHHIVAGAQRPTPLSQIPIVIGGAGPRTLELVAQHADWWNLPIHRADRFESMRSQAGAARVSIQQMATFVTSEAARADTVALAQRRFAGMGGGLVGNGKELVDHFGSLHARGVERFYVWFTDFAPPETLAAFGEQVIAQL